MKTTEKKKIKFRIDIPVISGICAIQVQMIQAAAALVDPMMRNYYHDPNKLVLTVAEVEAPQEDSPVLKLAIENVLASFNFNQMNIRCQGIRQRYQICAVDGVTFGYVTATTTNLESVYVATSNTECIVSLRKALLHELRRYPKFQWKLWKEDEEYVARIPILTFERHKKVIGRNRTVHWSPESYTLKLNLFQVWENVNFGIAKFMLLQLSEVGNLEANKARTWRTVNILHEFIMPRRALQPIEPINRQ